MKFVTLIPVPEPENFSNVRFRKADWEAAVKAGPIVVPFGTAKENIKLSGGLYKLAPEKDPVEVEIKGIKKPEEMSSAELVQTMTAFGKPPRKKMTRVAAVEFVKKLMDDAATMIGEDEEE